jgi:hypothetical protein
MLTVHYFLPCKLYAVLHSKSVLKFTHGSLKWFCKHNLPTPQSTHERTPHQAMWLYQDVMAGEELALAFRKGGKNFIYFLQL